MPSITELPLVALLAPAAATLVGSALGRPWFRRADLLARWATRLSLLISLAAVVDLLAQLSSGGTVGLTLWQVEPQIPITVSVDSSAAAIAVVVLAAALVVSFAANDRRPLASACLGLAVLGALSAAFAGDLLGLYIGLQLSALGGIGLSFARQPRAPSMGVVWAVLADQALGLVWLGGVLVELHGSGTLVLDAIPPAALGPILGGILILPVGVRLGGCLLISGSGRSSRSGHAVDLADWFTVVALPTSLVLLLRVQQLAGGSWPTQWFGTGIDLVALLFGILALARLWFRGQQAVELPALLLAGSALILAGFGQNDADGSLLGLAAAIFLELVGAVLPRALLSRRRTRSDVPSRSPRPLRVALLAASLPLSLFFGVALLGLGGSLQSGLGAGVGPAGAYLVALAALALLAVRLPRLPVPGGGWSWPLLLPTLGLVAAAALPGAAALWVAGTVALPGTVNAASLSAPDPLLLLSPALIWPGGYLVLLALLALAGWEALRVAAGRGISAPFALVRAEWSPPLASPARAPHWLRMSRIAGLRRELVSWYLLLTGLADRELGERPVWLWLATTALAAYLFAEWVKL